MSTGDVKNVRNAKKQKTNLCINKGSVNPLRAFFYLPKIYRLPLATSVEKTDEQAVTIVMINNERKDLAF